MVKRPFKKIGSKYYYIENNVKMNWIAAVHRCLEFGGHLASIQNVSEFNLLIANLKSHSDYWIDVNDLSTEGVFLSATTGLRANYLNWHSGNPNNFMTVEHCGALWFHNNIHRMNDDSCKATKFFICESENVN
ncbi:hypothetical protein KR044_009195 [Drosophila immigrans]|nr:hypothetical protein KR044_009195 [Drosophila immigrans]